MPAKRALAKVDHVGRAAMPGVLAALMALSTDAILVVDGVGRILSANPQLASLSGLDANELVGTPVSDILEDPSRPHAQDAPAPVLPLVADGSLVSLSLRLAGGARARSPARRALPRQSTSFGYAQDRARHD